MVARVSGTITSCGFIGDVFVIVEFESVLNPASSLPIAYNSLREL